MTSPASTTLTASNLTHYQRCQRLHAFEQHWRPVLWRPRSLFTSLLRSAVLQLSSGKPKETVTSEAVASFLEAAAQPGLDMPGDTYTIARCWTAILQTVIEAISRLTLLTVTLGPTVLLDGMQWQCATFADESGALHRWTSVAKLDSDTLTRELHSWHVWGDACAAQMPMTLHVVEVGRYRAGRQHTHWARSFHHPVMAGMHRFQKQDGRKLEGDWRPVWFQDSERNDQVAWVDLMTSQNVKLMHHLPVKQPSAAHCEEFKKQMQEVAHQMSLPAKDPFDIVMNRPACDLPWPCPFQIACYSNGKPDLAELGGFTPVAATARAPGIRSG
jgi:hypothetical protein